MLAKGQCDEPAQPSIQVGTVGNFQLSYVRMVEVPRDSLTKAWQKPVEPVACFSQAEIPIFTQKMLEVDVLLSAALMRWVLLKSGQRGHCCGKTPVPTCMGWGMIWKFGQ